MLMAHQLQMTGGDYVYVVVDQVPSKHVYTPWIAGDDQDETARVAFESVLQVRVLYIVTTVLITRSSAVPKNRQTMSLVSFTVQ